MNELNDDDDFTNIVRTILEMLRDRNYTFDARSTPDKFLEVLNDKESPQELKNQIAKEVPFINKQITNSSVLPLDAKGLPVFVYIQEGNETSNTFGDNQPDRQALAKQIAYQLRNAFPDVAGSKKINDIYEKLHLIVVLNITKIELIKFEEEALHIYNLEVWPKRRLRYNITKHVLSCRWTRLTPEEATEYKDTLQVTPATINLIRLDDPPMRYYYGQPGEIFHGSRLRADECYRLVVNKTIYGQNKKK